MVTMVPEFDLEPEPTEIIFLIDCSGSMGGNRISAAVRALQIFLRALPMNCHFNIIKFGSSFNWFFQTASQPYTERTLEQASQHVSNISANLGGTELLRPLNEIFKRPVAGGGRARQVFVLTDGEVSNTEQVIEACRRNAHNSRVFTVGIGDQVSRALVEGMARAATGTAQFITGNELNASSGGLEMKLINQLKLATQPSLTKIHIDWGQLSRADPPSFFAQASSSATSAGTAPAAAGNPTSVRLPTGTPVNRGEPSLLTFKVICNDTSIGEELFIAGDNPVLGNWDPNKSVLLSCNQDTSGPNQEVWAGTVVVPTGTRLAFKFIKKKRDGYSAWENFDSNREVIVGDFSETVFDAGKWNEKTSASAPAPTSAPTPSPPVTQHSVHVGGGVMMTGPSPGSRPVSKFFQTGPAQRNANSVSANAVGSGPAYHSPSTLAPAVGGHHNVSDVQGHARNGELYQAPFLPPPIFSNTKFVMYAFFAPGSVPTESIRISAESPEGPMDIDLPITKLESVGKTIHILGAKTLIRDLEEGTSHLHWRKTNVPPSMRGGGDGKEKHWFMGWVTGTKKAVGGKGQDRGSTWGLEPVTPPAHVVKTEMIDLGLRFGIVSRETSFVAVERWRDGRSGSSDVPLALPSQQVAPPLAQQVPPSPKTFYSSPPPPSTGSFGSRGGAPARRSHMASTVPSSDPLSFPQSSTQMPLAPPSASRSFQMCASMAAPPSASSGMRGPPVFSSYSSSNSYSKKDSLDRGSSLVGSSEKKRKAKKESEPVSRAYEKECEIEYFSSTEISSGSEPFDLPAAPAPLAPSGPPPTDLYMQQKFDGSFEISVTLANLLFTTVANLESGASSAIAKFGTVDAAIGKRLWASIYVLAALQKFWGAYESAWEMAAEKAKQWCLKTLTASLGGDRNVARRLMDNLVTSVF